MELNPLSLVFHPSRTVKSAVEKPNFSKAFFIILLPSIIFLASFLLIDFDIELVSFISYAVKNYILWFLTAAIIYFFVFLAKGKEMKGKFASIYSSISIIWLLISIAIIIVIIMSFTFSPKFFGFVHVIKSEKLSVIEGTQLMRIIAKNDAESLKEFKEAHNIKSELEPLLLEKGERLVNTPAMVLMLLVCIVLLFYALFVYPFLTIKVVTKLNAASSFVLYALSMGLSLFFALGISFF